MVLLTKTQMELMMEIMMVLYSDQLTALMFVFLKEIEKALLMVSWNK